MRVLLVGLFAFCLVTQAAAAAKQGETAQAPRQPTTEQRALTLDERLDRKVAELRTFRSTIRFFDNHRSLLSSGATRPEAKPRLDYAQKRVRQLTKAVAALRAEKRAQTERKLASLPPRAAICTVFGSSYCDEAVAVAWCESRLQPSAQNGQYLGLFQMGSFERRLFGHGATARDQAAAAHRYFVHSGRDWSPWSCRWAAS